MVEVEFRINISGGVGLVLGTKARSKLICPYPSFGGPQNRGRCKKGETRIRWQRRQ